MLKPNTDAAAQSESPLSEIASLAVRTAKLLESDPSLAAFMSIPSVSDAIRKPGLKTAEIILAVLHAYADRPALGWRSYEVTADRSTGRHRLNFLPKYQTLSYRELGDRLHSLINAWGGPGGHAVSRGEFACILGFTSVDYATVDIACIFGGVISVPLQTNLGADALSKIVREVAPRTLFTSLENIEKAVSVAQLCTVMPSLVVMDYEPRDDGERERYEAACSALGGMGAATTTLDALLQRGRDLAAIAPYIPAPDENPLMNIIYTSGSSGAPKGAMFPDSLLSRWWAEGGPAIPVITLAYQPLNHSAGRAALMRTLNQGGVTYFVAKSDMSTLFADARLARPTGFGFVPRIAEIIYDDYRTEVARRVAAGSDEQPARDEVMSAMGVEYLGGRLLVGVIGTAPTAPEISNFISKCFNISLGDGYGSTEAGQVTLDGEIRRPPVLDYKLVDVPELGYFTTDRPYPRGELRVKTATAIPGYFKNPEMTAQLFDADGFLIMGDIVEERSPDHIAYLDRRNNVIKLAQGEFVAIAQLEALFAGGDSSISQIYLYGNSIRSFLLGVIVPDHVAVHRRLGHEPDAVELKQVVRDAIKLIAQSEDLRAYEVPRDFIIELEPFTAANGLLTEVGKHQRPNLKLRYGEALEKLYVDIAERQRRELEALRLGDNAQTNVLDKVRRALTATLGLEELDPTSSQSFTELGGDSLTAVSLSQLLQESFGVAVPVGMILNPAGTQQDIAEYIKLEMLGGNARQVMFSAVHAYGDTEIRATDLVIDKFIDIQSLDQSEQAVARDVRTVLLTGATGFLGRFLCMEWLERLAPMGGKVICLIRAQDAATGRRRLAEALGKNDPVLEQRFVALAHHHLEVLSGDLSAPRLGLDDVTYARLSERVDLITHAAALVNHVMTYRQLFEPNVLGTAELIRLALHGRRKRFDYVSSIAVAYKNDGTTVTEGDDVRAATPVSPLSSHYASGYGTSKWAGEVLLRDAHMRFGLPVNVYRSDMILAHRLYKGQINVPDMFTRLLYSLIHTGIAPASFYKPRADGSRPHYNGLPVDFIARTMVAIGAQGDGSGFSTFHVENPHDDNISLDRFVDWMIAEGYPIVRIHDYGEWLHRFEERLLALPEKRRQQSSLAILGPFRTQGDDAGPINCELFREKVRQLATDSSSDIPQLSRAFIRKCLDDMVALKMVEKAPSAQRSSAVELPSMAPIIVNTGELNET